MIFPNEVFNFLKGITTKMSHLPMRHPLNPQMYVTDETGNVVNMSRTGKVEELFHTALIQTIPQLIMTNPALLPMDVNQYPPQVQLLNFLEQYGAYIGKYFGVQNQTQQQGQPNQQQQPSLGNQNQNNNRLPNNNSNFRNPPNNLNNQKRQ